MIILTLIQNLLLISKYSTYKTSAYMYHSCITVILQFHDVTNINFLEILMGNCLKQTLAKIPILSKLSSGNMVPSVLRYPT